MKPSCKHNHLSELCEICAPPLKSKKKPSDTVALELIDGAYDIVELWKAETPAQVAWKKDWMEKARKLGASPSWGN